ncbi:flagellar hook protein FlgE [Rhodoblastus acidophilus]|uniref:flagellar hook protein FlgE n=1 Tax=Rhodoblastus acidophilus TaxID=1074 RepID=UPI002224FB8E|nr:flagellar hook protein FlgE [Rhodoblastus acidophilus]MCW2284651.1 flagellar hook protein FlgE [Rhodoblastus acidophilus]MCW2333604.1 flagellar hook protein FlgE [Rhodoblastus acidophilus]
MGLYDAMNASVTGMNAQSNYLSNIGQNISNSSTVGYKQADTEFSTLVNSAGVGQTQVGGVTTTTRVAAAGQGTISGTSSTTDLAVKGQGYFVVSDSSGQNYLTRAGSFVPDASGNLVNAAGYYLMGYSLANGTPTMASNSLDGMQVVNIASSGLSATPSTTGTFTANLPSTDTAGTGTASSSNYNEKTSIVMYDSQGAAQTINVYFLKTGANSWDVQAYDANNLATSIGNTSLSFNASGKLSAAASLSISVPGSGGNTMALDLSAMTQLAGAYTVSTSEVNGNAASAVKSVNIGTDGTLSYQLANGSTIPAYTIPLANVASPENLLVGSGNVFSPNLLSGQATVGTAGTGQFGSIKSSSLEQSTVDVATELTNMIVAQRNYQANSKVFSTSAQLMDTLVNLQV